MEDLSGVRLKSHAPFLEEGERVIALSYSASSAAVGCAGATFDFENQNMLFTLLFEMDTKF